MFVRTALGPNAGPGLDVVRVGETTERREFVTVRSRMRFAPVPSGSSLAEQIHFGDPVVLLRSPFRLSFAFAGPDRVWKGTWQEADKLPAMIRLTVRDATPSAFSRFPPPHRFTSRFPAIAHGRTANATTRKKTKRTFRQMHLMVAGPASRGRGARYDVEPFRRAILRAGLRDRRRALDSHGVVGAGDDLLGVSFRLRPGAGGRDTTLRTEALVSASLELTAYQLTLTDDKARPTHGSFHFRMDEADVVVGFISEAARIDLNFASKEMLAGLLAGLGANQSAARDEADRIVGWRTRPTPGGANDEEALYGAAGLNYSPRQSLFAHVNELSLVVGLPPVLVERALPFVTVFNGSPGVDAAIAAPEVIAAMKRPANGFDERPELSNDTPAKADAPAPAASAKSPCYRIEASISLSNGRRTRSEAVIALGNQAEPYRVLSWQDDVEPRGGDLRKPKVEMAGL